MLLSTVMIVSLLPTAVFAADDQMQTAQDLSANAVTAVADKTAEAEAFEKEMEAFRSGMEKALKDRGAEKLTALESNIVLVTGKWEDVTATEGTDYSYNLERNTLSVSTAAGLAWMAKQVNSGSLRSTAVTLADDIDLSGKLWTPIKDFTGTFDGQGHKITGLTINNESFETEGKFTYLGLFQNIRGSETARSFVKNVTFENVSVYAPMFATTSEEKRWPSFGTVAGYSDYTDYENITVTGDLTLFADGDAAGIVYDSAYDYSRGNSIKNCKVENATVSANEDFYGITYNAYNAPVIENCAVSGSFFAGDDFAGIAYEAKGGVTIRGCSVSGDLYADSTSYGICYEFGEYGEEDEQNVMAGCSVVLNAWVDDSFFGLTEYTNGDSTTTNCHVSGTFYIDSEFCGLMEYLYDGGAVQDCSVRGKVYANTMLGGMDEIKGAEDRDRAAKVTRVQVDLTAYAFGGISLLTDETQENVIVSDCTFAGTYYSLRDYFAGIVGDAGGNSVTLKNCTVTAAAWLGKEAGNTYSAISNGGLVGKVSGRNLTITGCSFTGGFYMATTRAFYLGGLVGDADYCDEMVKITDSNVTGDMLCVAESIGDINVGGLIGGDSGWSADKLNIENCHFKGNLIAKATGDNKETKINRIGALAACIAADDLTVKNCTAESQIVLDGRCGGGKTNHAGAMFGGLKYPDVAMVSDCSFTGDVTVLGKEDALFDNDHFGMIVGEDCASKLNLSNITVNGDYYAEYAKGNYFGGGIGHRCCDEDLTANKVTINTDITMKHSGSVDDIGGFVGKNATCKMAATDCAYNGDITIEMLPSNTIYPDYSIEQLGGFVGDELGEATISHCSHTGNINVKNASIFNFGGFIGYVPSAASPVKITDSYTFGDITLTDGRIAQRDCGGQWIGLNSADDVTVKNCYSVGDITVDEPTGDDAYIGSVIGWSMEPVNFDNYYHAGKLTVNSTDGKPAVGYLIGNAEMQPTLTNVYYDEECFANSTLNGAKIELALGAGKAGYESTFVPLPTQQMQANRYETASSFKKLDGTPAVADPTWDYLTGDTYADQINKKAALVDALNAGKDGNLNWRVDGTSFRGYPFFGQSWSILYYADHGSGNELLHIESFDKSGTKAKEIPTPDPAKYPGMAYEWKDQDGKVFNANTSLDGDKMVYATLVRASSGSGGHSRPSSTGTLNIVQTDATDKNTYLPGAKFEIYDSNGKLVGTYTTDEKGQITVPGLANGKYTAVQVVPPKGYTQDPAKHEFTISNGKVTTLVLTGTRTGVPDMLNGDDHFAYIIGRSDGLVHPDAPITRAEVTTVFFRLLAPTVRDTNLSYTNTFSDVNADLWCNTAISTMTKLGIVHGRTATTFDPNAFITRAEFAAIAARFDKSSVSQLANFSDISGHWAALEISKAAANGWVNGYSDGTFKPDRNITRAEAMALINRVLNRVPETVNDLLPDMVTWPDNMNTSAWCYLDVQEATNSHDYERKSNGCETWTKLTKVPNWKIYEN